MSTRLLAIGGVIVLILGVIAFSGLFTVHQTQQALVLQFGDPRRVVTEPGLNLKIPFIQNVVYLDNRILVFDAPAEEIIASDQKRLVVDAYLRYRIADGLKFFQAVNSEAGARSRLSTVLTSALRSVLGGVPLNSVLTGERTNLMTAITVAANKEAKAYGIEVVDVRIKRTDLPEANNQAIYNRMKTEREREAHEFRAQGDEISRRIRSRADREKTVLIAEAQKQAQIISGEGDAKAIKISAEAFGKDIEFYSFYRSMQAYREALTSDGTSMVLSPDSEFFRFFGDMTGGKK